MKYIRQRENGSWQFRMYKDDMRISYTNPDLDKVIEKRNEELGYNPDVSPNILLIDIERSPMEVYTWQLFNQYITPNQVKEDWYLMCFAYKWLGIEDVFCEGQPDFPDYENGRDNEDWLVSSLWKLLDAADIVVAHNAKSFDIKVINTKFLEYGFQQPSPYKVVDTLKIAKKYFKISSNKLDFISKFLGNEGKFTHSGLDLWLECMSGDRSAWQIMYKYNKQDVIELEKVYLAIRGWDKSHPNVTIYYPDDERKCRVCGSDKLIKDRDYKTNLMTYELFHCKNCGHRQRTRKNLKNNKHLYTGV